MSLRRMMEPRDRAAYQTVNLEESKTVQSDRDKADIRKILQTYERNGVLVAMRDVDLAFRDVSEFADFAELMTASKEAEAAFMKLPSKVREAFDHSVEKWLDAAHDGLSQEQWEKLERAGFAQRVEDKAKPTGSPAAEGVEPPAAE